MSHSNAEAYELFWFFWSSQFHSQLPRKVSIVIHKCSCLSTRCYTSLQYFDWLLTFSVNFQEIYKEGKTPQASVRERWSTPDWHHKTVRNHLRIHLNDIFAILILIELWWNDAIVLGVGFSLLYLKYKENLRPVSLCSESSPDDKRISNHNNNNKKRACSLLHFCTFLK